MCYSAYCLTISNKSWFRNISHRNLFVYAGLISFLVFIISQIDSKFILYISGSTDVPVVETTPKFIQSLCYHLLLTSICSG
uniref:Uncharacterized protein n=1 Tax=Wuchereria bancrofti TaxID=6293 RepID=A0A1I8E8N2_WUCBA